MRASEDFRMHRHRTRPAPPSPDAFHIVTLGCAKNTVDSASMAELLVRAGGRQVDDPTRAGVIIVNTCGFLAAAREEALGVLRDLAARKRHGQVLIAAGCLTQRIGADIVTLVPQIDGVLGTRRWTDIADVVRTVRDSAQARPWCHLPDVPGVGCDDAGALRASVAGSSAYLKIADGCRRPCAFCAIPLIKGPPVSRSVQAIVADARQLRDRGVREIVLIAQDTTDYGRDLGLRDGLADLLETLVGAVPDVDWLRVLYAYPGCVTDRLIEVMAANRSIVTYLDMPLQHADPAVLRRMRRPADTDWVLRTVAKLREAMPGIALRSTFIVGYPGESDAAFRTLIGFLRDVRFDRVGAFRFSCEEGTAAAALGDTVSEDEKRARWDEIMRVQQAISLELNQAQVGRTLDVLVEGEGDGIALGRSYRDAPEIDGLVIVKRAAPVGALVPVRITGAMTYDLTGDVAGAVAGAPSPDGIAGDAPVRLAP